MRHVFLALVGLAICVPFLAAEPPELQPPPPGFTPGGPPEVFRPANQQFKELVPGLIDALKDTDAEVRQHSAMALAAIGQEAIAPLSEAIKDPSKEKRAAAAYALGQMGYDGREAMPALLKALKDDEASVRRSSSQAISRILNNEGVVFGRGMMGGFGGGGMPGRGFPVPPPAIRIPSPEKPD